MARKRRQPKETSAQLIKEWEEKKGRKVGLTPEEIKSWEEYNKKHNLDPKNRYSRFSIYNTYSRGIQQETKNEK